MKIVKRLDQFRKDPSIRLILAIGNFDGFHLGHQKLIAYVVAQAKKHRALSAVMTFRQHPQSVLHPEKKKLLLSSLEQKLFNLAQAGVDLCFLQPFTPSFSRLTAKEFVEKILVKKLHALEVCMGYDARFGRSRRGTTDMMRSLATKNGFLFKRMEPVLIGEKPISSSLIRELLAAGEIEKVNACLGKPFSLLGKVVKGKGHGTHLGFPTANLEVHSNILIPLGVYAASARFLKRPDLVLGKNLPPLSFSPWLQGVMNYGKRPTYPASETPKPVLEMHLFDFAGGVYGKYIELALHKFIRPEKRFSNEENLKEQILHDTETAKEYHLSAIQENLYKAGGVGYTSATSEMRKKT